MSSDDQRAGDAWTANTSSKVLTRSDLEAAMAKMQEIDTAAIEERTRRFESLQALNLDLNAATEEERLLLALAYEGHIFHPADFDRLKAAIERLRRDR